MFSHARPGTSDTSAVPTDQINNPGTINAIINTHQRPTFANEVVDKWRKVEACPAADERRVTASSGRSRYVLVRTRPRWQVLATRHT